MLGALLALAAMSAASSSHATAPGVNGPIAYTGYQDYPERPENPEIFALLGGQPMNLSRSCMSERQPDWAPDGSRLAFAGLDSTVDSPLDAIAIHTVRPDGTGLTMLLSENAGQSEPAWSPDGSRIAYTRDGENRDIYVMNADGTGTVPVASSPDAEESPAWSPDGTRLAYYRSGGSGPSGVSEIWVVDANGANPHQLYGTGTGAGPNLDWSPDGSTLAWSSGGFMLGRADGSESKVALTTEYGAPSFSPDGTKLVVYKGGSHNGLYVSDFDPASLTVGSPGQVLAGQSTDPDWGPAAAQPQSGPLPARCGEAGEKHRRKAFGQLRRVAYGVSWALICPRPDGAGHCTASLRLLSTPRRKRAAATRVLGRKKATIRASRIRTLTVRLAPKARRRLKRAGRLRVRVEAVVRCGGSCRRTRTRTLVLRPPAKRPKNPGGRPRPR